MAADDDRPRTPALEVLLSAVQLLLRQTDISAITSDEWPAVFARDRQVACASQHRAGNHGEVRQRVRDRTCRGQVSAIGDGGVARRRQRYADLLQEDHEEQAA